ncbi:1-acyl-sn-glycerol-3-phosphate acyltransferase [Ottowia sp. GY511]|uniref:Lysophospholipid acyltransferase family protein n=1 Tax=Ottowia flava TaxID=2675430 RepID=A0ABW4KPU8_9BURK|nr:lysophospholipid acyltransferase family protein [Ottowia sp. GY511]TXK29527.1 1-acyl-sn-glycerol-3-phosphate acyltransferase [Ottowia sp. GY511]
MNLVAAGLRRVAESLAMAIGLGLLAAVCLTWTPFALVLGPILPQPLGKRVGRRAIQTGFRLYVILLQALCGCRFDLKALDELARRPGPMVVVANHPSLLDAVLLVSHLPNAVCIMKALLMHNLLLGAGARMARYIVNDAPLTMIRSAIAELKDGARLIIFPEGTRTAEMPVGPCAATAGVIAARAGVPIEVVVIEMSSPYLGKQWPLTRPPRLPLRVRVRHVAQIQVANADAQRFGHDIRALLTQHLVSASEVASHSVILDDKVNGHG